MLKKITSAISCIFCGVLALILLSNLYVISVKATTGQHPTVFGYSAAILVSGSMSDSIKVDDMVITAEESDYSVGDVIMFKSGKSLVTHRIVEKTDVGYITKGDANNTQDADPVAPKNVVGKVVGCIPGAGKVLSCLQSPQGLTFLTFLCLTAAGLPILLEYYKSGGEDDGEQAQL